MHLALLVNPTSGRQRADQVAELAAGRLRRAGHTCVVVRHPQAAAAHDELATLIGSGLDGVVVIGGDGAVHGVLALLAGHDVTLGLVPCGTGNDLARTLGLPTKDPSAAVDVVCGGAVRTIDLALAGDAHVATVVASGFDSKVNERANAMTWPRGNMRYNLAIAAELRSFRPLAFTLELDGTTIEREAMLVAVGNGPSFGGGLRICEGAAIDDGLLDVVVINPVSKAKLLRVFPQLYRGTHTSIPEFERHRVRRVTLSSPDVVAYGDGERLGPLPITTSVVPGALRVFAPAPPP